MRIHDHEAAILTDEQAAQTHHDMTGVRSIDLGGCTVHIGQHVERGRSIVVETSDGTGLILSERLAPLTAEPTETPFKRLKADPRVAHVSWTGKGQIRMSVDLPGVGFCSIVADEAAADVALERLAALSARCAA